MKDNLKLKEIILGKPVEVKPKGTKDPGQLTEDTERKLRVLEGDSKLIIEDVGDRLPTVGFGIKLGALDDDSKLSAALGPGYKIGKIGGVTVLLDKNGKKVNSLTKEQSAKALSYTVVRIKNDVTRNLGVDGDMVFSKKDQVSRFLTSFAWHGEKNIKNKELKEAVKEYYKDTTKPSSYREVLKVAVPWSMERLAHTLKINKVGLRNGLVNRTMAQLGYLMGAEPFNDSRVYDQAKKTSLLGFNKKWEVMLRDSKVREEIKKQTLKASKIRDNIHLKEILSIIKRYKRAS